MRVGWEGVGDPNSHIPCNCRAFYFLNQHHKPLNQSLIPGTNKYLVPPRAGFFIAFFGLYSTEISVISFYMTLEQRVSCFLSKYRDR